MLGGIFDFFSVVGGMIIHSLQSFIFFFTNTIPDSLTIIGGIYNLGPSFLIPFISISLSLTIIIGLFKLLPF